MCSPNKITRIETSELVFGKPKNSGKKCDKKIQHLTKRSNMEKHPMPGKKRLRPKNELIFHKNWFECFKKDFVWTFFDQWRLVFEINLLLLRSSGIRVAISNWRKWKNKWRFLAIFPGKIPIFTDFFSFMGFILSSASAAAIRLINFDFRFRLSQNKYQILATG